MNNSYLKNVSTLKLDSMKCIGCGMCVSVCPHNVFHIEEKKVIISDADRCMECGACKVNCPVEAISVNYGVGCAQAVYTGIIRNTEPVCGCSGDEKNGCC